jgi:putative membrane protein
MAASRSRVALLVALAAFAFVVMMLAFMRPAGDWVDPSTHMAWGGIWLLVPIAAMGLMMYLMMTMMGHGHSQHGHEERPGHGTAEARAILDRRYAAGEVSREEYERIRGDIERRH